eukprot:1690329-Amphidinium_carterae.1
MQGGTAREQTETVQGVLPRQLPRPQQEDDRLALAAPSELSNEMLAAANTNPSNPLGRDLDSESWTLSTAVIGEQIPLPSPEDQAGAVVVVDSK